MEWAAVKAWLEENKGTGDVAAYFQAISTPTLDGVKTFLDTAAEGRAYLQTEKDKHFTKGLETWKANNLTALVDSEVAKRNPDKTPEMIKIEKLEAALADKEKAESRQILLNKALTVAGEKKLPSKLVERFLGEDEEKTLANLAEFETELSAAVQAQVDAAFKSNGYQPGKTNGGQAGTGLDLSKIVAESQIRQD